MATPTGQRGRGLAGCQRQLGWAGLVRGLGMLRQGRGRLGLGGSLATAPVGGAEPRFLSGSFAMSWALVPGDGQLQVLGQRQSGFLEWLSRGDVWQSDEREGPFLAGHLHQRVILGGQPQGLRAEGGAWMRVVREGGRRTRDHSGRQDSGRKFWSDGSKLTLTLQTLPTLNRSRRAV